MSISRRLEFLDWANQANAYVLEDDYASEFRFAERPLAALPGLNEAECVIYVGTFSKVLFPSLQIGYVILPSVLIDVFLKMRCMIDTHSPLLESRVLTDFIIDSKSQMKNVLDTPRSTEDNESTHEQWKEMAILHIISCRERGTSKKMLCRSLKSLS